MPDDRVNQTFTLVNFLLSRAASTIFHEIKTHHNAFHCLHVDTVAKKTTQMTMWDYAIIA